MTFNLHKSNHWGTKWCPSFSPYWCQPSRVGGPARCLLTLLKLIQPEAYVCGASAGEVSMDHCGVGVAKPQVPWQAAYIAQSPPHPASGSWMLNEVTAHRLSTSSIPWPKSTGHTCEPQPVPPPPQGPRFVFRPQLTRTWEKWPAQLPFAAVFVLFFSQMLFGLRHLDWNLYTLQSPASLFKAFLPAGVVRLEIRHQVPQVNCHPLFHAFWGFLPTGTVFPTTV